VVGLQGVVRSPSLPDDGFHQAVEHSRNSTRLCYLSSMVSTLVLALSLMQPGTAVVPGEGTLLPASCASALGQVRCSRFQAGLLIPGLGRKISRTPESGDPGASRELCRMRTSIQCGAFDLSKLSIVTLLYQPEGLAREGFKT
jgi:hypothetical protein